MRYLIFIILLMLFPGNVLSADKMPEKMQRVTVTGSGVTVDQAELNAFQSAVQQVVGTFVSSEQLLNNRKLKEEILAHSAGFIKEYEVLETSQGNGIINIRMSALVLGSTLRKKLEKLNVATADIKGSHLFSEVITRSKQQEDCEALLGQVWSKYPQAAYQLRMGELKIVKSNKELTAMRLNVGIEWDSDFLKELRSVAQQTAISSNTNIVINEREQLEDVFRIYFTNKEMLPSRANSDQDKIISLEQYDISVSENSLRNNINFNHLLDYNKFKPLYITLRFFNDNDQIVLVKKVPVRYDYFNDSSNPIPYEAKWPLMSKIRTHSLLVVSNLQKSIDLDFEIDTKVLKYIIHIKASFDSLTSSTP